MVEVYSVTEFVFIGAFVQKHDKYTVKPVLSGHSKLDKTKILLTNAS